MEKRVNYKLKAWLTQRLRRLSYQWPSRKTVKTDARVSRGKYECALCKEDGRDVLYGPKEIVLDHIEPVVEPGEGFVCWDTYINRLFCAEGGFQVLCKECHKVKTFLENQVRKETKQTKDDI